MVMEKTRRLTLKLTLLRKQPTWMTYIVYGTIRKWHFSKLNQFTKLKRELRRRRKEFFKGE